MRVFFTALLGAVIGAVATAWFGPSFLTWWGTPPVHTSCDCSSNMVWAMSHLVWAQLILSLVGAFLFLGLYMIFFRRKRVIVTTN